MKNRLRILHLSDLPEHAGYKGMPDYYKQKILGQKASRYGVLNPRLSQTLLNLPKGHAIDIVCFIGYNADCEIMEEYKSDTMLINAILNEIRVLRNRLFLVPVMYNIYHRMLMNTKWCKSL